MKLAALTTAAALTALSGPAPAQDATLEDMCARLGRLAEQAVEQRMNGMPLHVARSQVIDEDFDPHLQSVLTSTINVAYERDVRKPEDSPLTREQDAIIAQVMYGAQVEGACMNTNFFQDVD